MPRLEVSFESSSVSSSLNLVASGGALCGRLGFHGKVTLYLAILQEFKDLEIIHETPQSNPLILRPETV